MRSLRFSVLVQVVLLKYKDIWCRCLKIWGSPQSHCSEQQNTYFHGWRELLFLHRERRKKEWIIVLS